MKHRHILVAVTLPTALVLSACSGTVLPSWDSVRDDARAAMQEVVDVLPPGSEVDDRSTETPYGCSGDGVMYTGHWVVHPAVEIDGADFIDELPGALGSDWTVGQDSLQDAPSVRVESEGMLLTVAVIDADEEGPSAVDVLALSACGASPTPTP